MKKKSTLAVAGARFSANVQNCPGAHPASYTMGTGSCPVFGSVTLPNTDQAHDKISVNYYE